jgi:hypothetical protein
MDEAKFSLTRASIPLLGILLCAIPGPKARAQESPLCVLVPVAIRSAPGPDFVAGCTEYVLRYGGGSGAQGSYAALDFPACPDEPCASGAARYRCEWAYGYPCCIDSGACVPSLSGNQSGPTVQAIAARFAADTDQREGVCYVEYTGNGERLILAPITGPLQGSGSGSCYELIHYGQFFLTRIPGGGSQGFVFADFLGYVSSSVTPARAPTWGSIKELYR